MVTQPGATIPFGGLGNALAGLSQNSLQQQQSVLAQQSALQQLGLIDYHRQMIEEYRLKKLAAGVCLHCLEDRVKSCGCGTKTQERAAEAVLKGRFKTYREQLRAELDRWLAA